MEQHLSDIPKINGFPAIFSTYTFPAGIYQISTWNNNTRQWDDSGFEFLGEKTVIDLPASTMLTELAHGSDFVAVYDGMDGLAENLGSGTKFAEIAGIQNLTVNQHSRSNWMEEHSFYLT